MIFAVMGWAAFVGHGVGCQKADRPARGTGGFAVCRQQAVDHEGLFIASDEVIFSFVVNDKPLFIYTPLLEELL